MSKPGHNDYFSNFNPFDEISEEEKDSKPPKEPDCVKKEFPSKEAKPIDDDIDVPVEISTSLVDGNNERTLINIKNQSHGFGYILYTNPNNILIKNFMGNDQIHGVNVCSRITLDKSTFEGCTNLKRFVSICDEDANKPDILVIPERCFCGCENLRLFRMHVLNRVGKEAFLNCENLDIKGLNKVKVIEASAFTGAHINKMTLKKIRKIEVNAFAGCTIDRYIKIKSPELQSLARGFMKGQPYDKLKFVNTRRFKYVDDERGHWDIIEVDPKLGVFRPVHAFDEEFLAGEVVIYDRELGRDIVYRRVETVKPEL